MYGNTTFGWAFWTLRNVKNHWNLEWLIQHGYIKIWLISSCYAIHGSHLVTNKSSLLTNELENVLCYVNRFICVNKWLINIMGRSKKTWKYIYFWYNFFLSCLPKYTQLDSTESSCNSTFYHQISLVFNIAYVIFINGHLLVEGKETCFNWQLNVSKQIWHAYYYLIFSFFK